MESILLNFVNRSNDVNNSDILILQKNENTSFNETAVAWKVIHNCGPGLHHPFTFSPGIKVVIQDAWGNFTQPFPVENGMSYVVVNSPKGIVFEPAAAPAGAPSEFDIANQLETGSISVYCYRDGSVCEQKTNIVPGMKAVFLFRPMLYVGVVSQAEQGTVVNAAVLSTINTQFSLIGLAKADIVMTGGGAGPQARPFVFMLENVEYA